MVRAPQWWLRSPWRGRVAQLDSSSDEGVNQEVTSRELTSSE